MESWLARQKAYIENRLARPETVFSDKYRETLSSGHLQRQPPTLERLGEIDLDVAYDVFRDRFSDASDFTFVLVGNFEPDELEPLVLQYLARLPESRRAETWKDLGIRTPEGVEKFEVRRGLEQKSKVRLSFTGDVEWSREESHALSSLAQVLRTRLREVLREEMTATYGVGVWGGISRRPRQVYGFSISFGCAPENVEEMTQAVFDEIRSTKENGIAQSYMEKVHEIQTRKRETDLKENSFWSYALMDHYRHGTFPRVIMDYDKLVASTTSDTIQQAAKRYLNEERYVYGVLYPEMEAEETAETAESE